MQDPGLEPQKEGVSRLAQVGRSNIHALQALRDVQYSICMKITFVDLSQLILQPDQGHRQRAGSSTTLDLRDEALSEAISGTKIATSHALILPDSKYRGRIHSTSTQSPLLTTPFYSPR